MARPIRRSLLPVLIVAILLLSARLAERYPFELDLSAGRTHSLSASARRALDALPEPLTLLAFVPDLPVQRAELRRMLAPYLQHPGTPRLRFIDPVASPDRAREHGVGRQGELHLISGQRKEVVDRPRTRAIDLALNRLAMRGERWIVSLKGHGEFEIDDSPAGLGRLADDAGSLGYRMIGLDPRQLQRLPDNTAVLLIAGPDTDYGPHTQALISDLLDKGGRLLWMTDAALPDFIAQGTGVGTLQGVVVDAAAARYGIDSPDHAIISEYPAALFSLRPQSFSVLPGSRALRAADHPNWWVVGRLDTGAQSWNETGALEGRIGRDPLLGEQAGPMTVGLAIESRSTTPPARIVFLGSARAFGNARLGLGDNRALALGLLHWLSSNKALSADRPANDLDIRWSPATGAVLGVSLMALLPLGYLAIGLLLRWRRRRA